MSRIRGVHSCSGARWVRPGKWRQTRDSMYEVSNHTTRLHLQICWACSAHKHARTHAPPPPPPPPPPQQHKASPSLQCLCCPHPRRHHLRLSKVASAPRGVQWATLTQRRVALAAPPQHLHPHPHHHPHPRPRHHPHHHRHHHQRRRRSSCSCLHRAGWGWRAWERGWELGHP